MPDKKISGEELKIELTHQVKEKMAEDPNLAFALKDIMATFRQAQQLVHDGKYYTWDDAMASLGKPCIPVDPDDEASGA